VPPPLFAAVDVGTTVARAVAVDLRGRRVAEVRCPYGTSMPHPGWAEQDPREWVANAVAALGGLVRRLGGRRIVAIGLTGQCPTVAPYGHRGAAVGPGLLYRDNRAVAEAQQMRDVVGAAAMHRRTGHVAEAFHVGPKVLWLRRHAPQVYGRTRVFLQPRDAVLRRLTGRVATDETHANATLFFDLEARSWAPDLFATFGVDPSLFPEVLPPWVVAGTVRSAAAEETGLAAGTPVVVGAADSQCVAFGTLVIEPGPVSEMSGASSCLNSSVRTPRRDPRITHYSHVVPDRFTTELGVNTTGAAVAWAVDRLAFRGYGAFAAAASAGRLEVLGSGGGLGSDEGATAAPYFLPFLGDGERDDPTAEGGFVGVSERHDRAALAYATVEGVALAVAERVRVLRRAGCPVDELRVSGGGARLDVLGQLKADALGVPVRHLAVDASAVGAAMLAAGAAGYADEAREALAALVDRARVFEPDPAGVVALAQRAGPFRSFARRSRR
jgi:sugar (pentulose or hexulose) kinase